jgi:lipoprotein-releasing system permease protein
VKLPVSLLIAARYFRTRRREAGNASSLLSAAGIGVGVMTLTVVLAVMKGFQLGFIESIVEVSSYHLQILPPRGGLQGLSPARAADLRQVPSVTAVVPFVERQALVEGAFQRPRACVVRAVPPDLLAQDPSQVPHLAVEEGAFDLSDPRGIVIGTELATAMGARVGDEIALTSYAAAPGGRPVARRTVMVVKGVFKSGYYDFDSALAFVSLAGADAAWGEGAPLPRTWGIKIRDRFSDGRALRAIEPLVAGTGATVESWRVYNRSFFDALFVEKLMMMVLVGLIFLVVGFNVFHSLRRRVLARREEIAVLKAVGIPPGRIQAVFVIEGLLIGITGGTAGLAAGLALSVNIDHVFSLVEGLVNGLMGSFRALLLPFMAEGRGGGFSIFSPTYFYLSSVPSRVLPREAFLVALFALLACVTAAWAASRAVSRFRPAEVLRYE